MADQTSQPWAAMFTCSWESIEHFTELVYGKDPEEYVGHLASRLVAAVRPIVQHCWEQLNVSELKLLHEHWGQDTYPVDGWSWENVIETLEKVPATAIAEHRATGSPCAKESRWYDSLFRFLNDQFPEKNGVWIDFECPVGIFLTDLVKFDDMKYPGIADLPYSAAHWLGQVEALSRLPWSGNVSPEQWGALHDVISAWNEHTGLANQILAIKSPGTVSSSKVAHSDGRSDNLRTVKMPLDRSEMQDLAETICQRTCRRVIRELQEMTDCRLSGDDSCLKNVWDEICVQVQGGEDSVMWQAYEDTVERLVAGQVGELASFERAAIWLQTPQGNDWVCEDEEDRDPDPVHWDEVVAYMLRDYVYAEAERWSNPEIRQYLDR